jgi:hypothetical protein
MSVIVFTVVSKCLFKARRMNRSNLGARWSSAQGMQHAAHVPLQGGIDHLVLLHTRLALEGRRNHGRGIMVAVAGEVLDLDLTASGNAALIMRSISLASIAMVNFAPQVKTTLSALPAM